MTRRPRTGTLLLDHAKIDFALRERGLSWTSEKPDCDVSRATWRRIRNDARVSRRIAQEVAEFLGYRVSDLIVSNDKLPESNFQWPEHPEWRILSAELDWRTTSNGLQFFRCKVEHRHVGLPDVPQFGWARFYDLSRVADQDREQMVQRLTRHPLVCREFSGCPYIVQNLCAAPVAGGKFWWVVDKWFEARLLSEFMEQRTIDIAEVNRLMIQVASGLSALHKRGYLIRELSPCHILVGDSGDVRLTELDLAKLLFTDKTVSDGWSTNPYRAPEVADDTASIQSDLYSWAMVYLHLAADNCSLNRTAVNEVESLRQHSSIRSLLQACLAPGVSKRPKSADQVLHVLERDNN